MSVIFLQRLWLLLPPLSNTHWKGLNWRTFWTYRCDRTLVLWWMRSILISLAPPPCKQRAGSGCLLLFSVSSEQNEDTNKGVKWIGAGGKSEIWWHNWATREPGVCPQFMFSGTHSLKRAPSLGSLPDSVSEARGNEVMEWVQQRAGITSEWNREGCRIFTPAQTSGTVKTRSSSSSSSLDGLPPSSLLTLNIINNVGLLVKAVYMWSTPIRFFKKCCDDISVRPKNPGDLSHLSDW